MLFYYSIARVYSINFTEFYQVIFVEILTDLVR